MDNLMKTSKLFVLEPMENDVELVYVRSQKKWLPVGPSWGNENHIFVRGKGWLDMRKWKNVKRATLKPLKEITAAQLKKVKDEYGYSAAMGLVRGWGGTSLHHDNSIGLNYAKLEFCNACDLGELYDKYTDVLQRVGDAFIAGLLKNGFRMEGKTLWYGDRLVGFCGVYETIKLHPILHVDHCVGSYSFMGRMLPNWNPMTFETVLFKLVYAKYDLGDDKKRKKYQKTWDNTSVRDKIADLTTEEIASSFEEIFAANEYIDLDKVQKLC